MTNMRVSRTRMAGWLAASALCSGLVALASPAAAQSVVDEVVVTAQRRSERLEDVPITVTAVSGAKLTAAGISATAQLNQVVPAFRLDYNGSFAQPAIRGVSTALANVGGGSAVGVYVDGFYSASPLTSDFELLNVSGIQVLKGPQGTLFGRNTTGGAVLVTTSEPSHEPTFQARASYARFNAFDFAGYGSTGLTDNIAVDFAAMHKGSDGFMTNLTNNDDKVGKNHTTAFRAGVKFDFGDSNYILVRYGYADRKDPMSVDWSVYQDPNGQFETIAAGIPGALFGKDRRHLAADPGFTPFFGSKTHTGTITAKFDLGFADLTSYSQYRNEWSKHDIEVDNSNFKAFRVSFTNKDKLRTQEFLLNSKPGERLNWVAGLFYMDQVAGQSDFTIQTPPLGATYVTHLGIKSIAGFVDATYQTTDKLYLTVGGRYSHEKDDGFWTCLSTIACEAGPDKFTLGTHRLKGTWNNFSPRFVARYELDDNSSVYASWTRGFKAGLMNVNGFQPAPIEPEKITSYEVGYKVARGATRFEISSFYYDYKNLQVSSYNGTKSVTSNAATSKVYGGEFSAQQRVTDAFTLSGGIAYTHGRYKKYLTAPRNVFILAAGGIDNSPTNASGNNMQRSPDWTGNVAADYLMDVAGGQLALNGNVYFSSKVFFDPTNNNVQPSFTLVNVRATWTEASKHFSVSLWGNNILDEKYKTQVLPNGLSAAASWGSPATYGATVAYKY